MAGRRNKVNDDMQIAQLGKLRAEIRKLSRESDKLMMETRWYPLVLATALIAAIAALVKVFS
jgi:hypothetical protein